MTFLFLVYCIFPCFLSLLLSVPQSSWTWSFVSLIGCSLVTGYFSILTTLNIEVTHRRIKRKYWKISLAVQHQVAPHGVENCPILKYFQRNFSGVDCLNTNNKNKVKKSIEWELIFPIWLALREPSSIISISTSWGGVGVRILTKNT